MSERYSLCELGAVQFYGFEKGYACKLYVCIFSLSVKYEVGFAIACFHLVPEVSPLDL